MLPFQSGGRAAGVPDTMPRKVFVVAASQLAQHKLMQLKLQHAKGCMVMYREGAY